MGVLSGLFGDYQFDPHTYGNPGLGWLGPTLGGPIPFDRIQPSQGFPAAPPPRASAAPAPGPQKATAPQTSDNSIGREPGQENPLMSLFGGIGGGISSGLGGLFGQGGPGAPSPGLLDRLSAGATNLTTGGNPLAGIVNAVNGLATGQRSDATGIMQAQQNALRQALTAAGFPGSLASAAALSPEVLRTVAPRHYTPMPPAQRTSPRAPVQPAPVAPGPTQSGATKPPPGYSRAELEAEARLRGIQL